MGQRVVRARHALPATAALHSHTEHTSPARTGKAVRSLPVGCLALNDLALHGVGLHWAAVPTIHITQPSVTRTNAPKMNKPRERRSDCPINFSLQTIGDHWSMLIIRDIVYFGKKTYGEFLESDEHIATNILANRLARLEADGILRKSPHPTDKRKEVYSLTEKGLDLIPILIELAAWGAAHDPDTGAPQDWIALVNANKPMITRLIRDTVREGGAVFVGDNSVVSKLAAAG
jgi:DNA-binding HxlR family transcriptional regulator